MSIKDYFKKSVWDTFSGGAGVTGDFIVMAVITMFIAVVLGICIYWIYGLFYGGVVYSIPLQLHWLA